MAVNTINTCSETAFRPASCTRDFDFTLTFEQSVLSIIPSSILLLITPMRLYQLSRRPSKTWNNKSHVFKIMAAAFNVAVQLASVILWSFASSPMIKTGIPSAALSLANAVMILSLSYAEDRKSTRPSVLLNVYLLFSIIFDATQDRTLWLTKRTNAAVAMSASIGIKIVMLFLEERAKTPYLKPPYKDWPPEVTSGILNLSFVWWLNKLFVKGFRKLITTDDLYGLDPGLASETLSQRIDDAWERRGVPEGPFTLPKTVLYCFRWAFLSVVIPRLCLIGFMYAQPFLITSTIIYVENAKENKNHAYGLIGATFFIYLGIAISTVHFKRSFNRLVTMFRGAMISLLYSRSMNIQAGICSESAALTLMSTDVDNIIDLLENINDVWARSVELIIGTWLLERQLGAICIVPLVLTLVCAVGQRQVAKTIGQDQSKWNTAIQERVKDTSSILGSMKAVKVSGLSYIVAATIQKARELELKISRPFFTGIMWLNVLANIPMVWSPVLLFMIFAVRAKINSTDSLTTVQAFTSLSIITLVTTPASKLLAVLPQVAASMGCFTRIQEYLVSDSRQDNRMTGSSDLSISPRILDDDGSDVIELVGIPRKYAGSSDAVRFLDAVIRPAPKARSPAINNANFTIRRRSFTIILGPIGSGKTTLLKAMLGELTCDSGNIFVASRHISYCSQAPWLLNSSIKDCIRGFLQSPFDEDWYETVVKACALEEDIRRWPGGDIRVIGSKGFTLSGGQKQRLALARAVYSRKDIALLDDIPSALDMKTQEVLGDRLFSKEGLFRKLGTTVVLTTNSTRYLHLADKIIILDSKGTVVMQGSYKTLMQENKLSDLITRHGLRKADKSEPYSSGKLSTKPDAEAATGSKTDELMDATRRTGDLSVYWYYIRSITPFIWISCLVIYVLQTFTENFPQVWLNRWTSSGGGHLPLNLSIYAILALLSSIFTMGSIWIVFLRIMPKSAIYLHKKILDAVINAPQSFFAQTDTGITLNRFSQDMSLVDMALPISFTYVASALFNCLAQLALIARGSSYMAITIPFTLGAIWAIQNIYLKTSRQLRYLDLENKSPIYSHFIETLDGLPTLRAFQWQAAAKEIHINHLDRSQKPYYMLLSVQRWLNLVLNLMVTALAVIVVTLATQLRNTTTGGLLGIALSNILAFNQSVSNLVTHWTSLETSVGAVARVKTFSETVPSENKPGETQKPPSSWPENGSIQIENVSVTYNNDDIPTLNKVSMTIIGGEKVGICGRTGSGKSSLVLALLRLVDLSSGSISIDGIDISTLPREDIRQNLIAIPQDPFILPGSVRYNADPLGTISDDEIISSLKRIGIWGALEDRGGLDAILLDQPLSHGQQQLFCLGRAILRKTQCKGKVLILDEATSSVDRETDKVMQKVIKEELKGYTIISVAHRLDTIIDSDKIAVLDSGKLMEFNSPENLLRQDTIFRELYSS